MERLTLPALAVAGPLLPIIGMALVARRTARTTARARRPSATAVAI